MFAFLKFAFLGVLIAAQPSVAMATEAQAVAFDLVVSISDTRDGSVKLRSASEPVKLRLVFTYLGPGQVTFLDGTDWYQLQLRRDTVELPLLPERQASINRVNTTGNRTATRIRVLASGDEYQTELDVTEWYGPLEPGSYELTITLHNLAPLEGLTTTINFELAQPLGPQ